MKNPGSGHRIANNFDALRSLAALVVVASHAFLLTDGGYSQEPVFILSNGQTTGGGLAVLVFFVMSGYLVTQSFLRSPDPYRFIVARMLRIMPGLAVVLLLTAFVLGPLCATLPPSALFVTGHAVRYVAGNVTFLQPIDTLPGLFGTNPFPLSVNGSLWTLRYEVACYGLVLVLGVAGLLGRRSLMVLFGAALIGLVWGSRTHPGLEFLADFLAGAVYCVARPRRHAAVTLACAALCVASLYVGYMSLIGATAGALLLLHVATAPSIGLRWLNRYGDFSYGIYIYAFPIQQVAAQHFGSMGWAFNLAVSLPLLLACAALSWFTIERPALRYRPRDRGDAPPAVTLKRRRLLPWLQPSRAEASPGQTETR